MTSATDSHEAHHFTRVARSTERSSNSTALSSSQGPDGRRYIGSVSTRWSPEERDREIRKAPGFRHARPDQASLDHLCAEYTAITGDLVRSQGKRNFVASG